MLVSWVIITGMVLPRLSFGPAGVGFPPILRFKSKGQLRLSSPESGDVDHKTCIPRYHVYLAFSRGSRRLYQRGRYPNIALSASCGSRKAPAATDTPRSATIIRRPEELQSPACVVPSPVAPPQPKADS